MEVRNIPYFADEHPAEEPSYPSYPALDELTIKEPIYVMTATNRFHLHQPDDLPKLCALLTAVKTDNKNHNITLYRKPRNNNIQYPAPYEHNGIVDMSRKRIETIDEQDSLWSFKIDGVINGLPVDNNEDAQKYDFEKFVAQLQTILPFNETCIITTIQHTVLNIEAWAHIITPSNWCTVNLNEECTRKAQFILGNTLYDPFKV